MSLQSKIPIVLSKQKESYSFWIQLHRNLPRTERSGIGRKIDTAFLELLECTFVGSYLPPEQKILSLNKALTKLDVIRFFSQMAWENKLITTDKYAMFEQGLEEIGRQLGGWKKDLQTKTPQR